MIDVASAFAFADASQGTIVGPAGTLKSGCYDMAAPGLVRPSAAEHPERRGSSASPCWGVSSEWGDHAALADRSFCLACG